MSNRVLHDISVQLGTRTYPIIIGNGILDTIDTYLVEQKVGKQVFLITNPNIFSLYGKTVQTSLESKGFSVHICQVPEGEQQKSLPVVTNLLDKILSQRPERNDSVIALGGGVIGDLGGFVASLVLRGIHLFQVPTSLLGQVDACIGGKTGVNHSTGKNLIGAFYQPKLTLIDLQCLSTLPKHELKCGTAEIVKYGVIKNHPLFDFIQQNASTIANYDPKGNPEIWEHLIHESAKDKAYVVSNDERESGLRETLNFGHTIGHAIESAYAYGTFSHGEAVALGMIGASYIAHQLNMISKDTFQTIFNLITELGFKTTIPEKPVQDLMAPMLSDKKVKAGLIRFVLPTQIGSVEVKPVEPKLIEEAILGLMGFINKKLR